MRKYTNPINEERIQEANRTIYKSVEVEIATHRPSYCARLVCGDEKVSWQYTFNGFK